MSTDRASLITARPPGLVDVLDRILDKGLVIAGDIKVSLANVELLTLQIRLLVCSIDKAEQIGLNWWRYDSNLTTRGSTTDGSEVWKRLSELERAVKRLEGTKSKTSAASQQKPTGARRGGPGRKRS